MIFQKHFGLGKGLKSRFKSKMAAMYGGFSDQVHIYTICEILTQNMAKYIIIT